MAQTVSVIVTAEERVRLAAIVGDRSRPLKHVQRARIVLHSADRLPVLEVARRATVSRPAVWRWQRRYAEEGMDGLLRDKTRPPGRAPVPMTTVAKVLALNLRRSARRDDPLEDPGAPMRRDLMGGGWPGTFSPPAARPCQSRRKFRAWMGW